MEEKYIKFLMVMARTKVDDMRTFAGGVSTQHHFFEEFEELVPIMCELGEANYVEEMNPEMFEIKADFLLLENPTNYIENKHKTYLTCSIALANKFQKYIYKKFPKS